MTRPWAVPSAAEVAPAAHARQRPRPIAWIEFGRAIAILAVIAIHVVSPLVTRPAHPSSWWFGNLVDSAARWSVPLFVMLSGHLLLSSPGTADAAAFYRRRLARLGPPLVVWSITYLCFGHLVSGVPRDLGEALRSLAFGRPYYHLYFLFLIAGLYVAAPALRILVASVSRRAAIAAMIIAFGLAMGDSIVASLLGIGAPNAFTRFVPYVGYFIAGQVLAEVRCSRARLFGVAAVLVVGVLVTAIGTGILVQPGFLGLERGRFLYEYLSITTVPTSLAVFLLLVWAGRPMASWSQLGGWRVVSAVGATSFGVYLVHPIFLEGLSRLGLTARMTVAPVGVAVVMAAALVLSLLAVGLLRRIPGLRTIV